jgi:hypothetical protein
MAPIVILSATIDYELDLSNTMDAPGAANRKGIEGDGIAAMDDKGIEKVRVGSCMVDLHTLVHTSMLLLSPSWISYPPPPLPPAFAAGSREPSPYGRS